MRLRAAIAALLGLLLVVAVGSGGMVLGLGQDAGGRLLLAAPWAAPREQPLDVFGDAPAFGLTDQLERPVRSDELLGRVVIANFVYTNCGETCPLLSARMQALQDRLRGERLLGTRAVLLSFSVDPARDTPAVLRAYAERHGADHNAWRFLTGPERYVLPLVIQGFRLGVQHVPLRGADGAQVAPETYDTMHSNRFVLMDRQGRLRAYYDGLALDPDRVVRDVQQLLR